MSETVLVALIVSIISPLVLGAMANRHAAKMRREDWERQDAVAARVQEVATNAEANAASTDQKLDQIHTLVNSQMTEALLSERTALRGQLVLLREAPQTAERDETIENVEAQLAGLHVTLTDRAKQAKLASEQVKATKDA